MSLPTRAEKYAELMEHVRRAEEAAYMLAHLHNTEGGNKDTLLAKGWFGIGELFKRLQHQLTALAQGQILRGE